jgi:hypothetical protein
MLNMSGGCIPCILLFKHVKQVLGYCITVKRQLKYCTLPPNKQKSSFYRIIQSKRWFTGNMHSKIISPFNFVNKTECTCILLFMLNMSGGCIPCILLFKHVKQVLGYCICIWLFVLNILCDVTPYILFSCNRYGEMPLSRYFFQEDSVGEANHHFIG